MIGYHKLGTITYHNFSKVMISYDKFEGVFSELNFAFYIFYFRKMKKYDVNKWSDTTTKTKQM